MVNKIKRVILSKYNPFTFISAPQTGLEPTSDILLEEFQQVHLVKVFSYYIKPSFKIFEAFYR
jgi:hypothetical protein